MWITQLKVDGFCQKSRWALVGNLNYFFHLLIFHIRNPEAILRKISISLCRASELRQRNDGTSQIGVSLEAAAGILPSHTSTTWTDSLFDRKWNTGTLQGVG